MNTYAFFAALLFEVALGLFVIWGMIFRDKFEALIDAITNGVKKAWRAVKAIITSVKVRTAKRWLNEADIEIVSPAEKKQIVYDFLEDLHLIVQRAPGGNAE